MLSKQSIRKEHTIYLGGVLMEKEEIIEISKSFTETDEKRFRKMLQQGGKISIQGKVFEIEKVEKLRNSKGDFETPFTRKEED